MKKICMLAVSHTAKDDRIFFKECLSLKKHGYEVVYIHGIGSDGKIKDMSRKVLNPKGELCIEIEGVKNIGVPEKTSFIQRLLKKIFLGKFYRSFIDAAVEENADVYHAHELQSYYLALKISRKTGAKVIFDAHESMHEGSPKDKYIKMRFLKNMDYLIAANPLTIKHIDSQNSSKKIDSQVVYNASIIPETAYKPVVEIVIAHEGTFPFNRGLKLFLSGLKLLIDKSKDFKVKVIGDFNKEEYIFYDQFKSDHLPENLIELTGWKSYESLANELNGAAIGLILNTPTPNNLYGGPANKLFNYIAKNMCVVSVDLPETKRIVNQYSCGVILKDRNPKTLCDALFNLICNRDLLEEKRKLSHEAHKKLNWNMEAKKLTTFYDDVIFG